MNKRREQTGGKGSRGKGAGDKGKRPAEAAAQGGQAKRSHSEAGPSGERHTLRPIRLLATLILPGRSLALVAQRGTWQGSVMCA